MFFFIENEFKIPNRTLFFMKANTVSPIMQMTSVYKCTTLQIITWGTLKINERNQLGVNIDFKS